MCFMGMTQAYWFSATVSAAVDFWLILCNIFSGQIHVIVISVSWLVAWIKSCLIENRGEKMNDWKMSYLKIPEKSDKGEDLSCNFDMNCAINQMVLEKWLFILKNRK